MKTVKKKAGENKHIELPPGRCAVLVFDLSDEGDRDDFDLTLNAGSLRSAMWEYSQWLRTQTKHGEDGPRTAALDEAKDKFWEELNAAGVADLF